MLCHVFIFTRNWSVGGRADCCRESEWKTTGQGGMVVEGSKKVQMLLEDIAVGFSGSLGLCE